MREHQSGQERTDQKVEHGRTPAHHQQRGDQMRNVWRIWLECRLYIIGKGEPGDDPRLNSTQSIFDQDPRSSSVSTDNHLSATTKIGLEPKKRIASDSTRGLYAL